MEGSSERPTEVARQSKLREAVLDLERIEHNLYRASNHLPEMSQKQLYGGQIVSQAMVAASRTAEPHLLINSLHCYFIRKGNTEIPVVYQVENLRDGRSYSTRSVHAIQAGKPILMMIVSFHIKEESPYCHQYPMPDVPKPEKLLSVRDNIEKFFSDASAEIKNQIHRKLEGSGLLLEYRHIHIERFFEVNQPSEPKRVMWVRAIGDLGDDENTHRSAAAYISDAYMAWTAYLPHKAIRLGMLSSLDHSIWFHAPFRADDWMLYEMESPQTGAGRGMILGRIWRRDGTLAGSISQECMMRPKL